MKKILTLLIIACLLGSFQACKQVTPSPTPTLTAAPSNGDAVFTKYVAVGNSLTAGVANNGLYNASLTTSFPNILAGQFALVGGGTFAQPTFGAGRENGTGFLKLLALPSATNPSPTIVRETSNTAGRGIGVDGTTPLLDKYTGPLNNLGIPRIAVKDVLTVGYGLDNPAGFNFFFERLLDNTNAASTYVDFVASKSTDATFFSLWIGGNDLLQSAAFGVTQSIPDDATFRTNYQALLDKLTANGAKGVVLNIPNVGTYFNTITLANLQAAVQAAGGPASATIYITTESGVRAATDEDRFMLGNQQDPDPTDSDFAYYNYLGSTQVGTNMGGLLPYGLHPNNPLPTAAVIDKDEEAIINTRRVALNAIIQAEAQARDLAFVDINASLFDLANSADGFTSNGLTYRTGFITGGIIGIDGIHLTPAGNALVANEMIKGINAKYNATIPLVNPTLFEAVVISQ